MTQKRPLNKRANPSTSNTPPRVMRSSPGMSETTAARVAEDSGRRQRHRNPLRLARDEEIKDDDDARRCRQDELGRERVPVDAGLGELREIHLASRPRKP